MARQSRRQSERGAVIIHVAIALMALLAFTSIVVDYGIMWVSRRQAQNAADAGALAGALALMQNGSGSVNAAAVHFAGSNVIWGQSNSAANVDVTLSGPGSSIAPCDEVPGCVRVDVYRNMPDRAGVTRGDALPTYFAALVGLTEQGVRATATAQVTPGGNQVNCLLPFAVIDRWADNFDENIDTTYFANDGLNGTAGWTPNDRFQPASGDIYIPPYGENPSHNGWRVDTDYGRQLVMKEGSPGNYSAGWAMQVDLPDSTGSNDFRWNIQNCNQQPVGIAAEDEPCTSVNEEIGCVSVKTGVAQGPTSQGIGQIKPAQGLVGQDPSAYWDPSAVGYEGMAGAVVGGGGMSSARIRPIVIIDINHYDSQGCSGTTCVAKVANILGFFVEGMCEDVTLDEGLVCDTPKRDVVGRIVPIPGSTGTPGAGTVDSTASFIEIIRLVR